MGEKQGEIVEAPTVPLIVEAATVPLLSSSILPRGNEEPSTVGKPAVGSHNVLLMRGSSYRT